VVIWYIFSRFEILYEEKSGNPDVLALLVVNSEVVGLVPVLKFLSSGELLLFPPYTFAKKKKIQSPF
jgi:hypothetical protein